MAAIIFDGRKFVREKEEQLKREVSALKKKRITPKLVSIIVGNNPASILYVSLKQKAAERVGCALEVKKFDARVRYSDLNQCIRRLNKDSSVHGVMVQLPLPPNIQYRVSSILNLIVPEKDVDGLRDDSDFVPATVKAILDILNQVKARVGPFTGSDPEVLVVGAEGMVGRPLVKLLRTLDYKVIACDISTKELSSKTLTADLLISATGKPGLIKKDMVKDGVVIIDIGSPKGDVAFDEVAKKASFITPVPGGVGPVTIVSLLDNLLIATRNSI